MLTVNFIRAALTTREVGEIAFSNTEKLIDFLKSKSVQLHVLNSFQMIVFSASTICCLFSVFVHSFYLFIFLWILPKIMHTQYLSLKSVFRRRFATVKAQSKWPSIIIRPFKNNNSIKLITFYMYKIPKAYYFCTLSDLIMIGCFCSLLMVENCQLYFPYINRSHFNI